MPRKAHWAVMRGRLTATEFLITCRREHGPVDSCWVHAGCRGATGCSSPDCSRGGGCHLPAAVLPYRVRCWLRASGSGPPAVSPYAHPPCHRVRLTRQRPCAFKMPLRACVVEPLNFCDCRGVVCGGCVWFGVCGWACVRVGLCRPVHRVECCSLCWAQPEVPDVRWQRRRRSPTVLCRQ